MTRRLANRRMLLAALVAAGVVLTVQVAARLAVPELEDAEAIVVRYERLFAPPASQASQAAKPADAKDDPRVARVVKRHPFSPDPPKREFKAVLVGVLGRRAFMDGGNGVGVGDTHNGAKVVEIGPDWVRLEFEGKPLTLYVFGEGSAPSGGGPGPTRPPAMAGPPPGGPSSQPPVAVARPVSRGPREGPTLTPEQLAHIRAELAKMPPEERERAMASAPEHIRAQLAE